MTNYRKQKHIPKKGKTVQNNFLYYQIIGLRPTPGFRPLMSNVLAKCRLTVSEPAVATRLVDL